MDDTQQLLTEYRLTTQRHAIRLMHYRDTDHTTHYQAWDDQGDVQVAYLRNGTLPFTSWCVEVIAAVLAREAILDQAP